MLHKRRDEIVKKIIADRMVKVSDLVDYFHVSIETIRRDLEFLEQGGYLRRVYGGAVIDGLYGEEPEYESRKVKNYAEKQAIAAKTADLIENGDTVFVDVGTTLLEVARQLCSKTNLTVITNATLIANEIINNSNNRVILLGGELRRGELSVSGFICDENLKYFTANKAIIGVGGLTLRTGLTDYHLEESNNRRTMINNVSKVIVVADYSKFGVTAMNVICPLSKIDTIVTDWSVSPKVISDFKEAGVNMVIAERIE